MPRASYRSRAGCWLVLLVVSSSVGGSGLSNALNKFLTRFFCGHQKSCEPNSMTLVTPFSAPCSFNWRYSSMTGGPSPIANDPTSSSCLIAVRPIRRIRLMAGVEAQIQENWTAGYINGQKPRQYCQHSGCERNLRGISEGYSRPRGGRNKVSISGCSRRLGGSEGLSPGEFEHPPAVRGRWTVIHAACSCEHAREGAHCAVVAAPCGGPCIRVHTAG